MKKNALKYIPLIIAIISTENFIELRKIVLSQ